MKNIHPSALPCGGIQGGKPPQLVSIVSDLVRTDTSSTGGGVCDVEEGDMKSSVVFSDNKSEETKEIKKIARVILTRAIFY